MNRLRFGALLLMRSRRFGFYLSHRVVLTVPKPGPVRATFMSEFQPSQVFTVGGVALAFFDALTAAAESQQKFSDSFDMVKQVLPLPENVQLNTFSDWMKQRYGAELKDFPNPVPQGDKNK